MPKINKLIIIIIAIYIAKKEGSYKLLKATLKSVTG